MTIETFVGLDIGASTTKAVIIDLEKALRGYAVVFSKADFGIVGDLFELLPLIAAEVKKAKG